MAISGTDILRKMPAVVNMVSNEVVVGSTILKLAGFSKKLDHRRISGDKYVNGNSMHSTRENGLEIQSQVGKWVNMVHLLI